MNLQIKNIKNYILSIEEITEIIELLPVIEYQNLV